MKIHPINIAGFNGTLEELAQLVFRMRYDKVAEFMLYGQRELLRQSKNDKEKGKMKLSEDLSDAECKAGELQKKMEDIFISCKPFMKDELNGKK